MASSRASLLPLLALVVPLAAQTRPAGPDSLTRRAMALAYHRVEMGVRDRAIPQAQLGPTNQRFDQATLRFLGGQYQSVIASLDSIATGIEGDPASAARHRAEALRALDAPTGERRIAKGPGGEIAYRLYRPRSTRGKPAPVVVALHGAGADETAFLEAYGAGRLRHLADSLGFVLATPLTPAFLRSSDGLEWILADLASAGSIDRNAIYLIGHSLGAAAVWRAVQATPALIRAAVCLAGAGPVTASGLTGKTLPRTLVLGAELDIVVPPSRLEPAVASAKAVGWPIEYRALPRQGHTLMVGATLDPAITWLFTGR